MKKDRLMHQWGTRLRAVRIANGYETAVDFAAELGIDPPTYRKYERGDAMAPLATLEQIRRLTGKTLDFLLLGVKESDQK